MSARDEVSAHLERLVRRFVMLGPWPWMLAIAVFAAALYRRAWGLGFASDDDIALFHSETLRSPLSLWRAFNSDVWGTARGVPWQTDVYRPLAGVAWRLAWAASHETPRALHGLNALAHALASAMLLRLAWNRLGSNLAAVMAAAVFAAHTLHTDAVLSATGLADVVALLSIGAVYALHGGERWRHHAAAGALFVGALTHELSLVALPLLAFRDARDAVPASRWPARYAGYAAAVVAYAAMRVHAVGWGPSTHERSLFNPLALATAPERIVTAVRTFGRVTRLTMAPLDLLPDYAPNALRPSTLLDENVAFGATVIAVLVAVIAWSWRRRHAFGDAAASTLIAGLIAVNVPFVLARPFSERGWYIASAGACVLFGAALDRVRRRLGVVPTMGALGVILAALSTLTTTRHDAWSTNEMLMLDAAQVEFRSATAQVGYGEIHNMHGAPDLALRRCRGATRAMPRWAEPWGCVGRALERLGRFDEARAVYARMLASEGLTLERRTQHLRFLMRDGHGDEAFRLLAAMDRQPHLTRWHRVVLDETRSWLREHAH